MNWAQRKPRGWSGEERGAERIYSYQGLSARNFVATAGWFETRHVYDDVGLDRAESWSTLHGQGRKSENSASGFAKIHTGDLDVTMRYRSAYNPFLKESSFLRKQGMVPVHLLSVKDAMII